MSSRGLSLRRITGHCTVAGDRVTAWYQLAPQGWSFRPDNARERLVVDTADGHYTFDSVYPALGSDTHVELALQLGAELKDGNLLVDDHQRTTVAAIELLLGRVESAPTGGVA